jgi:glycosyltransferase involved in cell wall biosynthesis
MRVASLPLVAAREWLRIRRPVRPPGSITVVIVNWNAIGFLEVALRQVKKLSPPDTQILVIDNHSDVDPRPLVRRFGDARTVRLPFNTGHGLALDIGALLARTEFIVTLDVDAFPLTEGWLDALITPLRGRAKVSGCESHRPFAHPCGLAIRADRYLDKRHTFTSRFSGELGVTGWDVGELISMREQPDVAILKQTQALSHGFVGAVFADVLYHNSYGSRHLRAEDPNQVVLDGWMKREHALEVWRTALDQFGIQRSSTQP